MCKTILGTLRYLISKTKRRKRRSIRKESKGKITSQVLPFEDLESFVSTKSTTAYNNIDEEVFKVIQGVGHGGFGVVLKVQTLLESEGGGGKSTTSSRPSATLAMKVIPKKQSKKNNNPATSHANSRKLLNEIHIMKDLGSSSPFVQCLHDAYESANNVFILSEFIGGGDSFYYLSKLTKFSEKQVKIILAELFLGLEYIHSKGYLHCDIKAENVMFDRKGHVKIVDFGLARKLNVELPAGGHMYIKNAGSLSYMAPEMLADSAGGRHTDWWAYGVLAFEFFTGCSPWYHIQDDYVMTVEVCSRDVRLPRRSFSPAACELIEALLTRDYRHRLGTCKDTDIKKASFFKKINWKKTAELKEPPAFLPPAKNAIITEEYEKYVLRTFQEHIAEDVHEEESVSSSERLQKNMSGVDNVLDPPLSRVSQTTKTNGQGAPVGLRLGLKHMTVHYDREKKYPYRVSTSGVSSSPQTHPSQVKQFSDLVKPSNLVDRSAHLFEGLLTVKARDSMHMSSNRSRSTVKTGSMTLDSSFTCHS